MKNESTKNAMSVTISTLDLRLEDRLWDSTPTPLVFLEHDDTDAVYGIGLQTRDQMLAYISGLTTDKPQP